MCEVKDAALSKMDRLLAAMERLSSALEAANAAEPKIVIHVPENGVTYDSRRFARTMADAAKRYL